MDKAFSNILPKSLIEIKGPLNCGKSSLIYSIAIESIVGKSKILFVDADLTIANYRLNKMKNYEKYLKLESNASKPLLRIYRIFEMENLIKFFRYIEQNPELHNSILIIDSLNSFILNDTNETLKTKRFSINQLFLMLKSITHVANLITIFTKLDCKEMTNNYPFEPDISIQLNKINANFLDVYLTNNTLIRNIDNNFVINLSDLTGVKQN